MTDGQTPDPERWRALPILLLAGLMDLVDVTIVNVAIPTMQSDLGAAYADVEWVVASYVLGFAALLVTGGRLGDVVGRKRTFVVGLAGFTLASLLCGIAVDPGMLIATRFVQGATAGLMVPQILAIIQVAFPAPERSKVLAIWGAVLGSSAVVGLLLGGVLVDADLFGLGWRTIFLINVPIGIATLVAAATLLRESRSSTADRLDPVGMVLAIAAVLLLVFPLTEGRRLDWPWWTYLSVAASIAMLAVFIAYERWRTTTKGSPLVVLSLFRIRVFGVATSVWLIFWCAFGGFFIVSTLYMQQGLGWSALRTALTAAAFGVGAAIGSGMAVQALAPRFGHRVLMAGAALAVVGFATYALVVSGYGPEVTSWHLIGPLLLTGYGFGLIVAPTVDLVLAEVPASDAGSGSGTLHSIQQVGWAIGVALVGVLFFGQLEDRSDHGVDAVASDLTHDLAEAGVRPVDQARLVADFRACVNDRLAATDPTDLPATCRPAPEKEPSNEITSAMNRASEDAMAHAFSGAFAVTLGAAAAVLAVVLAGLFGLPRHGRPAAPPQSPVVGGAGERAPNRNAGARQGDDDPSCSGQR